MMFRLLAASCLVLSLALTAGACKDEKELEDIPAPSAEQIAAAKKKAAARKKTAGAKKADPKAAAQKGTAKTAGAKTDPKAAAKAGKTTDPKSRAAETDEERREKRKQRLAELKKRSEERRKERLERLKKQREEAAKSRAEASLKAGKPAGAPPVVAAGPIKQDDPKAAGPTKAAASGLAKAAPGPTEAAVPAGPTKAAVPAGPTKAAAPAGPTKVAAAPEPRPTSGVVPRTTAAPVAAAPLPATPVNALKIDRYINLKDLKELTANPELREKGPLVGIAPSSRYNSILFVLGGKEEFGAAVQVWKEVTQRAADARFRGMKESYPNAQDTTAVSTKGFFSYFDDLMTLVFFEPFKRTLVSVTCSTKVCSQASLLALAKRVKTQM